MLDRLISPMLIAAVIACPMWCGNGVYCSDQCCAGVERGPEEPSAALCSHRGLADCCCDPVPTQNDEGTPNRAPDSSTCQGICGGAVFERSCEFSQPDVSFLPPMIEKGGCISPMLAHVRGVGVSRQHCHSRKNHGRVVRTLLASLLC